MQRDTRYDDLVGEVREFLRERVESAVAAGLPDDKILVDPGIGFGKSVEGNLRSSEAASRAGATGAADPDRRIAQVVHRRDSRPPGGGRLEGSLAVAAFASAQGAHVIRAHDVAATVRAVRMIDAIREA